MKPKDILKNPPRFNEKVLLLNQDGCQTGELVSLAKDYANCRVDFTDDYENQSFTHWLPLPDLNKLLQYEKERNEASGK